MRGERVFRKADMPNLLAGASGGLVLTLGESDFGRCYEIAVADVIRYPAGVFKVIEAREIA